MLRFAASGARLARSLDPTFQRRSVNASRRSAYAFRRFRGSDRHALAAAFEQAGADKVIIERAIYTVEESQTWPNYTRATLIREL